MSVNGNACKGMPEPSNTLFRMATEPQGRHERNRVQEIADRWISDFLTGVINHPCKAFVACVHPDTWEAYIRLSPPDCEIFEAWEDMGYLSVANFVALHKNRLLSDYSDEQKQQHRRRVLTDLFDRGVDLECAGGVGIGLLERCLVTMSGDEREQLFLLLTKIYISKDVRVTNQTIQSLKESDLECAQVFLAEYQKNILLQGLQVSLESQDKRVFSRKM